VANGFDVGVTGDVDDQHKVAAMMGRVCLTGHVDVHLTWPPSQMRDGQRSITPTGSSAGGERMLTSKSRERAKS
jgi:hypothetical protein